MRDKYGIVCAMVEEAHKIITKFSLEQEKSTAGYNIYSNNNMVLIESSIGKVSSALATATLINNYKISTIINIGLAGALAGIKNGSAYLISAVTQHDAFIPFDNYQKDMYKTIKCDIPKQLLKHKVLTLTTGDQFITDSKVVTSKADLVDMEGYAVAYVADKSNKPVIIIKGVSDDADAKSEADIFKNLNITMDATIKILSLILPS